MIEKYRALITAVELGSVTRASEALGCTQSAVSHAIGSLDVRNRQAGWAPDTLHRVLQ